MEMTSVYYDPKYSSVKEKLKTELKEMRMKYKDSQDLDQMYMDIYKKK